MHIERHNLAPPLNHHVDFVAYIEGNNRGTGLPKSAMSLVFNLGDPFRLYTDASFSSFVDYRRHWVAGLQTGPSFVESYGQSHMIVIQLKPLATAALLRQPLHLFSNRYVPLDAVLGAEADELWHRLQAAPSVAQKFLLVEDFLLRHIAHPPARQQRAQALLHDLDAETFSSITGLCHHHRISRKHLNFICREFLGLSPKTHASLLRFQRVLGALADSPQQRLTGLAYSLEYFDQSHFNNQFKRFAGLAPTDYLRSMEQQPSLRVVPHFLPAV